MVAAWPLNWPDGCDTLSQWPGTSMQVSRSDIGQPGASIIFFKVSNCNLCIFITNGLQYFKAQFQPSFQPSLEVPNCYFNESESYADMTTLAPLSVSLYFEFRIPGLVGLGNCGDAPPGGGGACPWHPAFTGSGLNDTEFHSIQMGTGPEPQRYESLEGQHQR